MRGQVECERDDTRRNGTERSGAPRTPVDGPQRLLCMGRVVTTAGAMVGMPVPTRVVITHRLRVSVPVERGISTGHLSSPIAKFPGPRCFPG
jgi:hypothetical protein